MTQATTSARPAGAGKEAEMGFFDTVRDKAGALAADAERAGKVTAAQGRLVVLQNDLRRAERELGQEAFALVERGALDHPELAAAIERLRATTAAVCAKESEIASLRGAGEESTGPAAGTREAAPPTAASAAAEPQPAANAPATVVAQQTASIPVEKVAPEASTAEPAPEEPVEAAAAKKAPARRPSAKKASATKNPAKKPPAKKPAAGKSPAKKPATAAEVAPAAKPQGASKGGTGAPAGATRKKTARPSSSAPRPAGKKKPTGS